MPPETTICEMATLTALASIPGIPRDEHGPVFAAPWQAQAFAMALTLQQRGIFTWAEWADTLGAARAHAATAGAPDTGETYFRDWLATLAQMLPPAIAPSDSAPHERADRRTRHAPRFTVNP